MKSPRRTEAFTLFEVLVLIALVSMAVLALLGMQAYVVRCAQFNRLRHTASTIVASQIADARYALAHDFSTNMSHSRAPVKGQAGFESEVVDVVETNPDYIPAGDTTLRRITVRVFWSEPGREGVYSAWTYVYQDS